MFEKFTERARQVVVLAQDEARSLKSPSVGTEHLLLGLLREEDGIGARVLSNLGVTVEAVRNDILPREVDPIQGQIPMTDSAKKTMELALREALSLGHNYIGTEHILLGLVRQEKTDSIALRILEKFYVTSDVVKAEVIRLLSGPGKKKEEKKVDPPKLVNLSVTVLEGNLVGHYNFIEVEDWGVTDDGRFFSIYHHRGRDLFRLDAILRVEQANA